LEVTSFSLHWDKKLEVIFVTTIFPIYGVDNVGKLSFIVMDGSFNVDRCDESTLAFLNLYLTRAIC
jgi:hypothetical protein